MAILGRTQTLRCATHENSSLCTARGSFRPRVCENYFAILSKRKNAQESRIVRRPCWSNKLSEDSHTCFVFEPGVFTRPRPKADQIHSTNAETTTLNLRPRSAGSGVCRDNCSSSYPRIKWRIVLAASVALVAPSVFMTSAILTIISRSHA